jgi:aspartyl-tRNA(Asn)/glutamyl-tRNA(Gln) amidotransferase subunit B
MITVNGKNYYPTMGLEIHAELATQSKMFCGCKNDPDEIRPNVNSCPVCTAQPGTLPVPNKTAIESMITIGLAVHGTIANFSEFDRKNYFYPDIPKAYQISQYKYPIVSGGELAGVAITRIHLEEDTGTSIHEGTHSLVDFNRAGVPLMELVTEPVIHDADTAMNFGKELQLLLRTLGVGHANMEKGEMRVELNISISENPDTFGTKVEVKNLNSFSVVGKAAAYEIDRMIALYEANRQDEIIQETRGWDEVKQATFAQRKKESSHDYRYFPDPDLPKLYLHDMFDLEKLQKSLPELPWQKRARYAQDFGIKTEDIESYVVDKHLGEFFEEVVRDQDKEFAKLASNYITSDLLGLLKIGGKKPSVKNFKELIQMLVSGEINSRIGKDLLTSMTLTLDFSPRQMATEKGLIQKNDDSTLEALAQKTIETFPDKVSEYKSGKEALLMFFVGHIMKETKGSANPQKVQEILKNLMR